MDKRDFIHLLSFLVTAMGENGFVIVTNNPLVYEKERDRHEVEFYETSYAELMIKVRDMVHEGSVLLTHPLSGSVKPWETPYKSILVKRKQGPLDTKSLNLIEGALEAAGKMGAYTKAYRAACDVDFQVVDYSLITSGIESAEGR